MDTSSCEMRNVRTVGRSQVTHNKQLERTVIRRRVRAACASFRYALATRWTRGNAAAQLRRSATQDSAGCVFKCLQDRVHSGLPSFTLSSIPCEHLGVDA